MEPQETNTPSSKKGLGIGIAVVAILAVLGITLAANKKSTDQVTPVDTGTSSATTQTTAAVATTPAATSGTAEFKDGTYSATGSYMSPGGADQVAVSLTLKNDIITDATVTPEAGDQTSAKYQAIFVANYKQYVIGKDISTVKLDKVSGSSLTGQGFNAALAQIETQAKA